MEKFKRKELFMHELPILLTSLLLLLQHWAYITDSCLCPCAYLNVNSDRNCLCLHLSNMYRTFASECILDNSFEFEIHTVLKQYDSKTDGMYVQIPLQ